ncbi:MAG: MFS transporter [Gemmatimonadaceae bacterium]|nr:MFS transporter [Gemmatimonadaceae bacterium]
MTDTGAPRNDAHARGKLVVLMITAFMDMVGILMVVPLLPFYAQDLNGSGYVSRTLAALHMSGDGAVVSLLIATFAIVQLVSAPYWGRVSDRFGRRPAMMIGLGGSALAYLVFAYAPTLDWLFLSRIVQGAGGGTVGVIQAYVADTTRPEDRAKALGWLSAATNAGVALGPVIGGGAMHFLGRSGPGLSAALMSCITMLFAYHYLTESHDAAAVKAAGKVVRKSSEAVLRVVSHGAEPASRLIWIYAITMGSFQAMSTTLALFLSWRFGVTASTIGFFFTYIGTISVITRALVLGKMVDRFGEARLSRLGMVLLAAGLAGMPLAPNIPMLAVAVALVPLGTAFTFPCVTGLLSRVVASHERGLYMGVQQTFGGIARVAGPLYFGWAYDHLGPRIPFLTAAVVVLLTITLGLNMESYVTPTKRQAA